MRPRQLGRDGLLIAPIGLNAVHLASAGAQPAESRAIMSLLLDAGQVLVDVTDVTGPGEATRLLRAAVRERRDRLVLAVRATPSLDHRRDVAANLRRLGTDQLDAYLLTPAMTRRPIEEGVGELAGLVESGLVRHIGLFTGDAQQLRRAHAVHPIALVGAEYSLLARAVEQELLPTVRELGVGFIAYRPLGCGVLTGSLTSLDQLSADDPRRADPLFQPERLGRALSVTRGALRVAVRRHLSASRLALAWLLAQGEDVVALPGTRSLIHLEMNFAAAGLSLSGADLLELSSLPNPNCVTPRP